MLVKEEHRPGRDQGLIGVLPTLPPWQLDIVALTGHDLESRGREELNRLLTAGWHLLHIYTLKYEEDGVWQMAILGRLWTNEGRNG